MKQKLLTLMALLGITIGASAALTSPTIEGITLPNVPGSALAYSGTAAYADANGNNVFSPMYAVYGSAASTGNYSTLYHGTWITSLGGSSIEGYTDNAPSHSGITSWTAPAGSVFRGSSEYDGSYVRRFNMRTNRTFAIRFTGTTGISMLGNPASATSHVYIAVYQINGDELSSEPVGVGDISGSNTAANEATGIVGTVNDLSVSSEYVAYVYGTTSGNGAIYEIALLTPDYREKATLSFSETSASASIGTAFTAPTLSSTPVAAASEATYSSSDESVATVNASTGVVKLLSGGTTTITASITGSENYKDVSASYTLTVSDPSAKSVTYSPAKNSSFDAGATDEVKDGSIAVATITYSESGGAAFKFDKNSSLSDFNAMTEGNGTNGNSTGGTFYTIVPKYNGTITVGVVVNKDKGLIIEEDGTKMDGFDGENDKESEKLYGTKEFKVKAGSSYKLYVTGSKLGFYGFIYSYSAALLASITSAGYATFVPSANVAVPSGVKAYIVTEVSATGATLSDDDAITVIPVGAPVIIKGDEDTYAFPMSSETASSVSGNKLNASSTSVTADGSQYILAQVGSNVGFYKATAGSTIAAGKAFLVIDSDEAPMFVAIGGDNNTTAIEDTTILAKGTDVYYNLNGQRVAQPAKGLYIVNGKKVIIK